MKYLQLFIAGWANSKETRLDKKLHGRFIERFIELEKLDRPVIVVPSMSGQFAIPYLMTPKPQTCRNRARAFVTLAPTFSERFTHDEYHICEVRPLNSQVVMISDRGGMHVLF